MLTNTMKMVNMIYARKSSNFVGFHSDEWTRFLRVLVQSFTALHLGLPDKHAKLWQLWIDNPQLCRSSSMREDDNPPLPQTKSAPETTHQLSFSPVSMINSFELEHYPFGASPGDPSSSLFFLHHCSTRDYSSSPPFPSSVPYDAFTPELKLKTRVRFLCFNLHGRLLFPIISKFICPAKQKEVKEHSFCPSSFVPPDSRATSTTTAKTDFCSHHSYLDSRKQLESSKLSLRLFFLLAHCPIFRDWLYKCAPNLGEHFLHLIQRHNYWPCRLDLHLVFNQFLLYPCVNNSIIPSVRVSDAIRLLLPRLSGPSAYFSSLHNIINHIEDIICLSQEEGTLADFDFNTTQCSENLDETQALDGHDDLHHKLHPRVIQEKMTRQSCSSASRPSLEYYKLLLMKYETDFRADLAILHSFSLAILNRDHWLHSTWFSLVLTFEHWAYELWTEFHAYVHFMLNKLIPSSSLPSAPEDKPAFNVIPPTLVLFSYPFSKCHLYRRKLRSTVYTSTPTSTSTSTSTSPPILSSPPFSKHGSKRTSGYFFAEPLSISARDAELVHHVSHFTRSSTSESRSSLSAGTPLTSSVSGCSSGSASDDLSSDSRHVSSSCDARRGYVKSEAWIVRSITRDGILLEALRIIVWSFYYKHHVCQKESEQLRNQRLPRQPSQQPSRFTPPAGPIYFDYSFIQKWIHSYETLSFCQDLNLFVTPEIFRQVQACFSQIHFLTRTSPVVAAQLFDHIAL